jgi:hypothetical protein
MAEPGNLQFFAQNLYNQNDEKLNLNIIDTDISILEINESNKVCKFKLPEKIQHTDQRFLEILEYRSKLYDWLIIVCKKCCQSDITYFSTVNLTDKIFEEYQFKITLDDMYLILITCLFIVSKREELWPIRLSTIISSISHNKFNKKEILSAEIIILKILRFKISKNNFVDIANIFIHKLSPGCDSSTLKINELLYSNCKSLYKLLLLDYNLYRKLSKNPKKEVLFFSSICLTSLKIGKKHFHLENLFNENDFFQILNSLMKEEDTIEKESFLQKIGKICSQINHKVEYFQKLTQSLHISFTKKIEI